jgi:molecular chaperone GrpE
VVLERDPASAPPAAAEPPAADPAGGQAPALVADVPAPGDDRDAGEDQAVPPPSPEPAPGGPAPEPPPAGQGPDLLAAIAADVRELAGESERYHARAQQREAVIDHLHAEVERLRRGERRGLMRPLLVEICRLRDDLLRQAGALPEDYSAAQAGVLLRSYAESVELALESNGVTAFEPDAGDAFEPRRHRRVGAEPTTDPALVGRVARVRRSGYLDVDADAPIAPAEVAVYAAVISEPAAAGPTGHTQDGDQQ